MKNLKLYASLNILLFISLSVISLFWPVILDNFWGLFFIPVLISLGLSVISIYKKSEILSFILSFIPFVIWLAVVIILYIYKPVIGGTVGRINYGYKKHI